LHLLEAASSTHSLHATHLAKHALATEAAAKASSTAEEVVIVIEHAKSAEWISSSLSLLLLLLLLAASHSSKRIVLKKVSEWVSTTEEVSKYVICLLETKASTATSTAEAREEGRLTSESGSTAATSTLFETFLAISIINLSFLRV